MQLLAVDVGGYTQDILLLDTSLALENSVKMVMPSATIITARRIQQATEAGQDVVFTGVNMGGGPCRMALHRHLDAGLKAYATPEAACTFDDDLEKVRQMGVMLVSPDEAGRFEGAAHIEMKDIDLEAIGRVLETFHVSPRFDAVAVAVQDHGAAPSDISDRIFRFQFLRRAVAQSDKLTTFAYLPGEIPQEMTRMQGVARTVPSGIPLLLLDTGPAAALGALEDREVAKHRALVIMNVGNFHTLAFHLKDGAIMGLFEHHSRSMDAEKLDSLVGRLVTGNLTNEDVFNDGGHGCFVLGANPSTSFVTVTGPGRRVMAASSFSPYFAAPHGDMMLSGCSGLARAFALRVAQWRDEIEKVLGGSGVA